MQRQQRYAHQTVALLQLRFGSRYSRHSVATFLMMLNLLLAVEGGLIVKRQIPVETTTVAGLEEISTAAPVIAREIEFQPENKSQPQQIEFGFNNSDDEESPEKAVIDELQPIDSVLSDHKQPISAESQSESVTSSGIGSTRSDAPTTVVAPTSDSASSIVSKTAEGRSGRLIQQPDPTDVAVANTTSALSVGRSNVRITKETFARVVSVEPEEIERAETTEETLTTIASVAEESIAAVVNHTKVDSGSGDGPESEQALKPVSEPKPSDDEDEESVPRFDLNRYISPSNYSDGGISLAESRSAREQFFAEQSGEITTELPAADVWEASTTLESLASEESATERVAVVETNEIANPSIVESQDNSVESNRTVRLNRSEIETADYEVVSNEVRNQTGPQATKGKKGKFLDQFGATEDNDINGAAWALAGMRVIDRSSGKAGQSAAESVEIVRDDNENVVVNNTLKQLMDWAMIVQDADFANGSYVRPTSGEVDLKSELNDRRKGANKTFGSVEPLSEENRITSVVTEVALEATTELATELPSAKVAVVTTSATPVAEADELEDFKFENREKVFVETTKRPDLTNFIHETTTVQAITRPTRGYEVSEFVDENQGFALPRRTTTGRIESSTVIEDVPVTTYSPVYPLLRKTESTTETMMATRFESMRTRGRRPMKSSTTTTTTTTTTSTTPEPPVTTTTVKPAEETVPPITTTVARITTTIASMTTTEINAPLLNELINRGSEGQDDSSPEVDPNAVIQTHNEIVVSTSTAAPTTQNIQRVTDPIIAQQSTIFPAVVEFRPAGETTDKIDLTGEPTVSAEVLTNRNQPVLIDEKNVYDTVAESTNNPVPEPEPTASPEPDAEPSATTRRSLTRLSATTELAEEESATEEDYVEVNSSANGNNAPSDSSSKSPLDQEPTDQTSSPPANEEEGGSGAVVAVVASLLSVALVLLLIAAYVLLRKRQAQVSYGQRCRPVGLDAYSLDNVSVYNSVRRKGNTMRMSKRSYGNSAFEDPGLKTNPLTVAELANIIQNKTAMYDEFKEIPNVTARADEVPDGCEEKNRYANVVPLPETRVHLKRINEDEKTEYINANFVKGPKDSSNYYIACQAPMENTINDFWRMIWEQNSKVIIMATDLSENGVEKCAEYLPPSVVLDNNRTFGDFQLTLKNRENKEKYTISTVHLRNTQTNTWREIMHFWYQWPDSGVPIDESSIIAMLLEARSYSRLAPAEMADASAGITSIAEEDGTESDQSSAAPAVSAANGSATDSSVVAVGNNNVDNSSTTTNNNSSSKTTNDGGAPNSIVSNGGTLDKHKSLQRTQGPLTVHCSPGTGRTGTIIACDVALRAVEIPPRTVDIPHIVYYVRRGRASAVRTREQYELIYRVANVYATKLTGPTIET
ncbi:mucin-5AC isoform X2 [Malaya genurostris]|uniref:mucin-5AC isoform X2 n=1 Tax=Malaya genurostris TaxID=325434 RepID=UPI0026F3D5A5|nr:mucin-5AC isoform X2 [Malaya genurostris]